MWGELADFITETTLDHYTFEAKVYWHDENVCLWAKRGGRPRRPSRIVKQHPCYGAVELHYAPGVIYFDIRQLIMTILDEVPITWLGNKAIEGEHFWAYLYAFVTRLGKTATEDQQCWRIFMAHLHDVASKRAEVWFRRKWMRFDSRLQRVTKAVYTEHP